METTAPAHPRAAATQTGIWARRPWLLPVLFGVIAVLWRIPFVVRYDLHFQTESGVRYLMAKRILLGEFPIYFWSSDYMGTLPQFVTAGFFRVFGSSIELACLVSALAYGAAVTFTVWYVQRWVGKPQAICGGVFAAVGVPYLIHYTVQPPGSGYDFLLLVPIAFLWLAAKVHETGWTPWRSVGSGLLIGHCWYYNKQSIVAIATVGLVFVATAQGRDRMRKLFSLRWGLTFAGALLLGVLPEVAYRLRHESRHALLGIASPTEMAQNLYWLVRVLPAYFDGDPLSRLPEGVHYLQYNPRVESLPHSLPDWIGIGCAVLVTAMVVRHAWISWKSKDIPVLMLALYPLVNGAAVMTSKFAVGEYYAPKRYLFQSAIFLLMWAGVVSWRFWSAGGWKRFAAVFLYLLIPMSAYHQLKGLSRADELRDYRALIQQLKERNYHYGVTWYTYAFAITGLSNEEIILSALDYNQHEPYDRVVRQENTLVLVYPSGLSNLPDQARFFDAQYRREGPPTFAGELAWVVFQKSGQAAAHPRESN